MNTGKQNIYTCTEEEAIRSLAFMENDFLYGIAQESDIVLLEDGSEIFPMGIVRIVDENGEEVRKFDYSQEQKYVTAAAVKKNRIELQCLKKTAEGRYETALSEPITGNIQEKVQKIEKKQISHEIKRLETIFSFQEAFTERKRKMISPKEVLYEDNRTLNLETEGTKTQIYLVYGKGQLQGLTEELGEAVLWADQMMGSVVDENGQYLWRRGNRKTSVTIESISTQEPADTGNGIEACAQILLRMENDYRDLSEDIAAGKTLFEILDAYSEKNVCNLSGCSLSMVLYYVSQGQPAAVITSQGQAELLIGYDSSQVVILDPITGEVRKENLSAAESRYEAFGNVFISFIE